MKKLILNLLVLLMVANLFGERFKTVKMENFENKVELKGENTIKISVKNQPISSLLKLIAKRANKNIIIEKSVSGTITLDLHNIHYESAMELIAKTNGYKIMYSNDTYIIGNAKKLYEGFYEKRYVSFEIKYSDIINLSKNLKVLFPNVKFAINTQKNIISAITSDVEDLQLIKKYIDECEKKRQNVINCTIEVLYTQYTKDKKEETHSKSYNFIVNSGNYTKILTENREQVDKFIYDEVIKVKGRLGTQNKIIVDMEIKTKDDFFDEKNRRIGNGYDNRFSIDQNKKERVFSKVIKVNNVTNIKKEIFLTVNHVK